MKISMIGAVRLPSRESGIDVAIEELSTRMAEMGEDVTVFNHKGAHKVGYNNIDTPKQDSYEYKGVHVKTAYTVKNKALNDPLYYWFATMRAIKCRSEIIHMHGEISGAVIHQAKKRGKKVVVTIHGLDWKRFKSGSMEARRYLDYERKIVQAADAVIVLSQEDKQYFQKTYKRDVKYIPSGISQPVINAPKVIKLKHALNGDDYILYVGRIVPEKGVHTLVEAYSKSGIEVPLVLAGGNRFSDEYYQTIKAFAEKFNDKSSRARRKARIIMAGFAQGRELEELYSNAVLYVHPSEVEGMSSSIMEAMSYGNICLVSDIPQNTAIVEQHGYCFANKDVESLRDSMRDIIGHLKAIREQPGYSREDICRHIIERYNWDITVRKTLEIYKAVKGIRDTGNTVNIPSKDQSENV